jgi:hypothetical protein
VKLFRGLEELFPVPFKIQTELSRWGNIGCAAARDGEKAKGYYGWDECSLQADANHMQVRRLATLAEGIVWYGLRGEYLRHATALTDGWWLQAITKAGVAAPEHQTAAEEEAAAVQHADVEPEAAATKAEAEAAAQARAGETAEADAADIDAEKAIAVEAEALLQAVAEKKQATSVTKAQADAETKARAQAEASAVARTEAHAEALARAHAMTHTKTATKAIAEAAKLMAAKKAAKEWETTLLVSAQVALAETAIVTAGQVAQVRAAEQTVQVEAMRIAAAEWLPAEAAAVKAKAARETVEEARLDLMLLAPGNRSSPPRPRTSGPRTRLTTAALASSGAPPSILTATATATTAPATAVFCPWENCVAKKGGTAGGRLALGFAFWPVWPPLVPRLGN